MSRDQLLSNLSAMRKDAAKAVNLALAEQVASLIASADMDHDEATTFARQMPDLASQLAARDLATLDDAHEIIVLAQYGDEQREKKENP